MGNACCNYKDKDTHALNYGKKSQKPVDSNLKAIELAAKENIDKLVKVQAAFRGHFVRKHLRKGNKASARSSQRSKGPKANNKNGDNYIRNGQLTAIHLNEMPDYSNSATKATEMKLG